MKELNNNQKIEKLINDNVEPKRDTTNNIFNESIEIKNTNNSKVNLKATDTGLVIGQEQKDGFEQSFTFPRYGEGGEIVVDKNLPYVTPEMFGAVGDGITDDYKPIQKAIDVSSAEGKILIFGHNKKYLVKRNLLLRSNTFINLNSSTLYRDFYSTEIGVTFINIVNPAENIVIYNGTLDNNRFLDKNGNIISSSSTKNMYIKNVTFKYVTDVHALDLCNYENITVKNCIFEGFRFTDPSRNYSEAIQIDPCYHLDYPTRNNNLIVSGCKFIPPTIKDTNYGAWGVGVGNHSLNSDKNSVINTTIENCDFIGCVYAGIRVYGWENIKVINNRFNENRIGILLMTGTSDKVQGVTDCQITGNIFKETTYIPIEFSSVDEKYAKDSIEKYRHKNITISSNHIRGGNIGIFIKNAENVLITNNKIENTTIQTHINNYVYLKDIKIEGNNFNNSSIVFYKSSSDGLDILNNVFRDKNGRNIHLTGNYKNNFKNTRIIGNSFITDFKGEVLAIDANESNSIIVKENTVSNGSIKLYSSGHFCELINNSEMYSQDTVSSRCSDQVYYKTRIKFSGDIENVNLNITGAQGSKVELYNDDKYAEFVKIGDKWVNQHNKKN